MRTFSAKGQPAPSEHTNELTMEFLLKVLKDWVQPGDRVFTACAGTKILIAAMI